MSLRKAKIRRWLPAVATVAAMMAAIPVAWAANPDGLIRQAEGGIPTAAAAAAAQLRPRMPWPGDPPIKSLSVPKPRRPPLRPLRNWARDWPTSIP